MKKWIMILATVAMSASLVACNKGGGGSSTTVTGPTNCTGYARDAAGRFLDPVTGQVVNCDPNLWGGNWGTGVGGINCQPAPYEGCAGWSRCFPGNTYVPMPINGQLMCVNTAYFWGMNNFGTYYNQYGGYPTSTCIPGMNCSSSCVSLGGGTSGSSGGYFFGGNVNFCF